MTTSLARLEPEVWMAGMFIRGSRRSFVLGDLLAVGMVRGGPAGNGHSKAGVAVGGVPLPKHDGGFTHLAAGGDLKRQLWGTAAELKGRTVQVTQVDLAIAGRKYGNPTDSRTTRARRTQHLSSRIGPG